MQPTSVWHAENLRSLFTRWVPNPRTHAKRPLDQDSGHFWPGEQKALAKYIKENVSTDVEVMVTDELPAYPKAMIRAGVHGSKHKTIRHRDKVYVRGDVHTNTVENAFSLLKRGSFLTSRP